MRLPPKGVSLPADNLIQEIMNPYIEVGDYSLEERKGHTSLVDSVSFLDSDQD